MPRLCRESEDREAGTGETTSRRSRIRAIAERRRASRAGLQRMGRWNEQGLPFTVSRQGDAFESASVGALSAADATDSLGRQRWFVDEQMVWCPVLQAD